MKIAVVWNNDRSGVLNRFGQSCPEKYGRGTVQRVATALREAGHDVLICEGDRHLLATLETFMPPDPEQRPTGIVFNMAYGIQGECRYSHIPGILELAGVPYTGSSPLGHALALDKVVAKRLMLAAGVPTPRFCVMRSGAGELGDLRFPLIVKPRHESTSFGLALVEDRAALLRAVEAIVASYHQDALVEEYIEGREICVGLFGNEEIEVLPLVEHDFGDRPRRLVTWEDKMHRAAAEPVKLCPAPIDEALAERLREMAIATFRACSCRDFARIDFRIDTTGNPFALEINSMAALGAGASFVLAAKKAEYDYSQLVCRIIEVACRRYRDSTDPIWLNEVPPVVQTARQPTVDAIGGLGAMPAL
jgi:D-alanine-D-alanine ligase